MYRSSNNRTKFPPSVRDFCLRIQFHSTSAYNELRKFFNNCLPTIRTLQRWLRCVEVTPGISDIALGALAEKVKSYKDEGKELHVCLMSDEMGIRKQVTWNTEKETFDGFATSINTKSKVNSKLPLAKDAWVFMVVGPNFKLAVAYFLVNGLESIDRAVITREVIRSIAATGARVVSLTGDGINTNVVVAKLLGADFKSNKPYFPCPSKPNDKIYVIFDPPHMLKLVRKYLSEKQLYYQGDKLNWDLLVKLAEKQYTDNVELGNKLTKHHINWKQTPMVVRLAVETLSNSVADTLEQLNDDKYDDFIGCEALVKFIRLHNNVYDFLNYGDGKKTDEHFKNVLGESNIDKFTKMCNEYKDFISKLEIDEVTAKRKKTIRKKVLNSKCSMGFFGFWHNLTSAFGIYYDYVQNGTLDVFYFFQFCQDHLETFFSLIREALGANNNPTTEQFKSAFRKLLICTPNLSAKGTNCLTSAIHLLTVSSAQQPICQPKTHQTPLPIDVSSVIERIHNDLDYNTLIHAEMDDYERHLNAYLASTIETNIIKKIMARPISKCSDCLHAFSENVKIEDSFLKKKSQTSNIVQPCRSTVNIIVASNAIMKILQSIGHIDFNIVLRAILPCLDIDSLFDSSDFIEHQNEGRVSITLSHKEEFICNILREYMHLKSKKICDRITAEEHKAGNVRKKNTKNIIFAGQ